MNHTIQIYSTPTCHFCHLVKDFLAEKGFAFQEYNVAEDANRRTEMIQKTGQLGVPVIDIDGEITIGFDKERISSLLGI